MVTPEISAIVFDIGGVLVDWNPEYLYGDLIPDPTERAAFLTEVCSPSWNHALDAGGSAKGSVAVLAERHPERAHLINAWWERWHEMLGEEIPGTRAQASRRVGARTTWWAECLQPNIPGTYPLSMLCRPPGQVPAIFLAHALVLKMARG